MATHVRLLDNGTIKVGDREIPKKRRRDEDEDAERDYRDLYRYLGAAINRVNSMQNKLSRIHGLSSSFRDTERVPGVITDRQEQQEQSPPATAASPSSSSALALAGPVESEQSDSTAHEASPSVNSTEGTLALFDPDHVASIGEEEDDTLSSGTNYTPPLTLDPTSYLAKSGIRFSSWAHKAKVTDDTPIAQQKKGRDFPHKKRKETAGEGGRVMCWLEANRPVSVTAKLTVNGKDAGVDPAQILSQANSLLKPGERVRRELRFRAYVVDGDCTTPHIKSSQTRPTSVGEKPTISNGCVYIDENDGARFTTLLNPFHRRNPHEYRFASAEGQVITFDEFKFRREALSGRISNSSGGSLRIVIAPEHPVLKRLQSFYTVSDEFKVAARVRPITKPVAGHPDAGGDGDDA
jgi:hypothetical protein